jgi:hypothetical protein
VRSPLGHIAELESFSAQRIYVKKWGKEDKTLRILE